MIGFFNLATGFLTTTVAGYFGGALGGAAAEYLGVKFQYYADPKVWALDHTNVTKEELEDSLQGFILRFMKDA